MVTGPFQRLLSVLKVHTNFNAQNAIAGLFSAEASLCIDIAAKSGLSGYSMLLI
jgi:hypothetical protein